MKFAQNFISQHPLISNIIGIICLAGIVIISRFDMFVGFLTAPFIQGWDGAAHQAVAEYYSAHIFPSVWGWIPLWYAGMPFPQFYPPLFYFLVAAASHLFPFLSILNIIKIFVMMLLISLPLFIFKLARELTNSLATAWLAAFLTCLFMSSEWFSFGGSVVSSLGTAMIPQLLGLVLVIMWLNTFLSPKKTPYGSIYSIIILGGVLLSNAHIVLFSLFLGSFMGIAEMLYPHESEDIFSRFKTVMGKYLLTFGLAAGISACWYFPLLTHYRYFTGISIPEAGAAAEYVLRYWYLIIIGSLSLPAALSMKNRAMVLLSFPLYCFTLLIIAFSFADSINFTFPIHVARWLTPHLFLNSLLVPYGLFWIIKIVPQKPRPYILSILILFIIAMYTPEIKSPYRYPFTNGYYLSYEEDGVPSLVSSFPHDGRLSNVEVNLRHGQPTSFVIDAALGRDGVLTTFSNLRESSISSLFLGPFRNTISDTWELWGSPTLLGKNTDFYENNYDTALKRARFLGVQNFLTLSFEKFTDFEKIKSLNRLQNIGDFSIFAFRSPVAQAAVLAYEPILMFGPVNFREHTFDSLDYVRMNEEYFEDGKDMNTLVSLANEQTIETSVDIGNFSYILLAAPTYKNSVVATEKVTAFAAKAGHQVLVVDSGDTLTSMLRDRTIQDPSLSKSIHFFDPKKTHLEPFKEVIAYIRKHPISSGAKNEEASIFESDNKINVNLNRPLEKPSPVTIKRSYFPEWKRSGSAAPVYLASPTYMLTFATSSFELDFITPKSVYGGWLVTASASLCLLIGALFISRKIYQEKQLDTAIIKGGSV